MSPTHCGGWLPAIPPSPPEVVAQLLNPRGGDPPADPTRRKREALSLMTQGLDNASIAARLFITDNAVHKHTRSIFAKLGLPASENGTGRSWPSSPIRRNARTSRADRTQRTAPSAATAPPHSDAPETDQPDQRPSTPPPAPPTRPRIGQVHPLGPAHYRLQSVDNTPDNDAQ